MKIRKSLSSNQAEFLGLKVRKKEGNRNPRYSITQDQLEKLNDIKEEKSSSKSDSNEYATKFVLSAWNEKGYMMDIDEYCKHYSLPRKDITSYKLVSHTGTPFYNIVFRENKVDTEFITEEFFDNIVKKNISIPTIFHTIPTSINYKNRIDRAIYTDVHIGMTPNKEGNSLYGGIWDAPEQRSRFKAMCVSITEEKSSDELIVDDLGDYLDGWNSLTSRGGHELPQNMNNQEAFDVGVEIKVMIADMLAPHFKHTTFNNITNDNHSGNGFDYVVNSAAKKIIEAKYTNVSVNNYEKFINHYFVGDHCFVLTHGKDAHALKFGFKPKIDEKQISKIDQYLKENDIYRKSKYIHFCKGDSHLALYDHSSSNDFDYNNYPAFSPASEWIQTNYSKSKSGYVIESIKLNEDRVDRKSFWFNWNK